MHDNNAALEPHCAACGAWRRALLRRHAAAAAVAATAAEQRTVFGGGSVGGIPAPVVAL